MYLLDENVLRAMRPGGNAVVAAWMAGVRSSDLRLSVLTLLEKRRGWERRRRFEPDRAVVELAAMEAIERAYVGRILPVDIPVVVEWARLLGAKDKNFLDRGLAATAKAHGLALVTRNVDDFRGCGVRVIDPFRSDPVAVVV